MPTTMKTTIRHPENGQSVCYKLPSVVLLEGTSGRYRSENSSSTVVFQRQEKSE